DHSRPRPIDLLRSRLRHRLKAQLLEGGNVQVRCSDLEAFGSELLFQRRDLPSSRRRGEPVQIDNASQSGSLHRPDLRKSTTVIGEIGSGSVPSKREANSAMIGTARMTRLATRRFAPLADREAYGRSRRRSLTRVAQARWKAPANRPDPIDTLERSHRGRVEQ